MDCHEKSCTCGCRRKSRRLQNNRRASTEPLWAYISACGSLDALFCFSADIAVSACRALREQGGRILEDVLVAVCDGSEEGEHAFPALTTIVQPTDRMCSLVWESLANRLQNPGGHEQHVTADAKITIRASSTCASPK